MRLIELECPVCGMELEVDSGFAGGVCRCSQCGTLMTVPADPDAEPAEELHIAERPAVPSGTGTLPTLTAELANDLDYAEADSDAAPPEAAAIEPDLIDALPDDDDEVQIYTTASGRTIEIHKQSPVAVAHKRRMVRAATYGIFAAIALVMLLVAGAIATLLIISMNRPLRPGPEPGTEPPVYIEEPFEFDPFANPLLLDKPNILGLPMGEKAVVVLDTSVADAVWLKQVDPMLAKSKAARPEAEGLEIRRVADKSKIAATVTAALAAKPAQLVVVFGNRPDAATTAKIVPAVKGAKGCETSIFIVDDENFDLFDAATPTGGQGQMLSSLRLQTWTEQAAEEGGG